MLFFYLEDKEKRKLKGNHEQFKSLSGVSAQLFLFSIFYSFSPTLQTPQPYRQPRQQATNTNNKNHKTSIPSTIASTFFFLFVLKQMVRIQCSQEQSSLETSFSCASDQHGPLQKSCGSCRAVSYTTITLHYRILLLQNITNNTVDYMHIGEIYKYMYIQK